MTWVPGSYHLKPTTPDKESSDYQRGWDDAMKLGNHTNIRVTALDMAIRSDRSGEAVQIVTAARMFERFLVEGTVL